MLCRGDLQPGLGIVAILFPASLFRAIGMPEPNYPALWQVVGIFVIWWPAFALLLRDAARVSGGWMPLLRGE